MGRVCKRRLFGTILVMALIFTVISPALASGSLYTHNDLNVGPYVDTLVYKVIANPDQRILALQAGEIEMDTSSFDPVHLPTLSADPDIDICSTIRNGYGHITINCNKYPFNISAFRRAFAYAINKTRVTSELLSIGIVSQEHDSVVPYSNGWCIEDELRYDYYDAQVETGSEILDDTGFDIDLVTGFRTAPDGSPFVVSIQMTNMTPLVTQVGNIVSQAAVDALAALDIDATVGPRWPHLDNLTEWIDHNEDFDMAYYAYNFPNTDVDWLGYHFWGELADVQFTNPCNFRNAEYDSWRTQLLQGTDYEEVYEAAAEMQRILHENVPMVVVYENFYNTQAFRNDLFTGHIEDPLLGIHNPWNLRNMRRINGSSGGTVPVAISSSPNTFNIYLPANDGASQIMAQLWPSLYLKGPDHSPVPYVATDMKRETYSDDSMVPQNNTRFTIDIVQNANWTDGTPLTAQDVVYSLKYALESGVYGNSAGESLTNLLAAYAPSTYRAVIEFKSDSYWHFSDFAYDYIIPKHIFENIGYSGWNSWDPVLWNTTETYVTAGPFRFVHYEPGEWVELSANPNFWYHPDVGGPRPDPIIPVAILSIGGIVVVIVIVYLKKKGA